MSKKLTSDIWFRARRHPAVENREQQEVMRRIDEIDKHSQYIKPLNVKKLFGHLSPGNYKLLAYIIDMTVQEINAGVQHVRITLDGGTSYFADELKVDTQEGFADRLAKAIRKRGARNEVLTRDDLAGGFDLTIKIGHEQGDDYFCQMNPHQVGKEGVVHVDLWFNSFHSHNWVIRVPLFCLMRGFSIHRDGCMGYFHQVETEGKVFIYAGITQRDWLTRMAEHIRGIGKGEKKLFYNAWREFKSFKSVTFASSLETINYSFDEIMEWEEVIVDKWMRQGISLNAIPGGFKGLRELHKLGLLARADERNLDARDTAIDKFQAINPRAGIPNLLLRELWEDDSFAAKIICGREDRLSVEQVREIRRLAMWDIPIEKIAEKVNARNISQVARVLAGETYSRIH